MTAAPTGFITLAPPTPQERAARYVATLTLVHVPRESRLWMYFATKHQPTERSEMRYALFDRVTARVWLRAEQVQRMEDYLLLCGG